MSSFLPEKTFVVCTMEMSLSKGQLLASPGKRNVTVIHSIKDAALLTTANVILFNDFSC